MTPTPRQIKDELQNQRWIKTTQKMQEALIARGIKPIGQEEYEKLTHQSLCVPNCPECGGSGYVKIKPNAEVSDREFGQVRICANYRKEQLKHIDPTRYGLERDEIDLDWNLVKNKIGNLRLEAAKAVTAVRPAFERGHGMILLWGAYGQGKSLVGKILTACALRAGRRAVYAHMGHIIDDIRLAFDEKENMNHELVRRIEYWNSLDVLFIDELDKAAATEWAADRMFTLLDQRYVRATRQEALTVIASNKKDDELDGYLASRLKDNRLGPIIYLQGDDFRQVAPRDWTR